MQSVQFAMEQYNLFLYKHNHIEVSTEKVNTVILRNKNNVIRMVFGSSIFNLGWDGRHLFKFNN
jgi:hypothetical protein